MTPFKRVAMAKDLTDKSLKMNMYICNLQFTLPMAINGVVMTECGRNCESYYVNTTELVKLCGHVMFKSLVENDFYLPDLLAKTKTLGKVLYAKHAGKVDGKLCIVSGKTIL